jgi:hypothetical protein
MIYKLYGQNAVSADGQASVDVREDDSIEAIALSMLTIQPVDGMQWGMEVSFGSSSQFTINDTNSTIISMKDSWRLVTSGAASTGKHLVLPQLNIPISAGERIFLHLNTTNAVTIQATAFLYTKGGPAKVATRRR